MFHYATDIIRFCSEILVSEGLCCVETSHFICNATWLTGFCMGDPLLGSAAEQTMIFLGLYLFTSGKLETDLTYVTSLYSAHICTRRYYLYTLTPLTLMGLVYIY